MAAPDIVMVADATKQPIEAVTSIYFALGAFFRVDQMIEAAHKIELADHFDRLALDRRLVEIASIQRRLTAEVLATGKGGEAGVQAWVEQRGPGVARVRASIREIIRSGLTLSKLAVAVGLLADLAKN